MNEKKTYYGRPDTSPVSTVALSFIGQSSILFSRLDDLLSVWGEREEHSRDGEGPGKEERSYLDIQRSITVFRNFSRFSVLTLVRPEDVWFLKKVH